jgi:hypothetical protein
LLDGVSHTDLHAAKIYPDVWDHPDELAWAVSSFSDVARYFTAPAATGDAIICVIG